MTPSPSQARQALRAKREAASLRKRENTRARLVDAAADVIEAKGLGAARIDDVVRAAGFTRGAFYSNFSSLDEVLVEALTERSATLLDQISAMAGAMEEVSVDAVMALLEQIRPAVRSLYMLSTDYTLHLMRHPEERSAVGPSSREFDTIVTRIITDLLHRMGRHPLVPIEVITSVVATTSLDSVTAEAGAARPRRACGRGGAEAGVADDAPAATDAAETVSEDSTVLLRRVIESVIEHMSTPLPEIGTSNR